MKKIAPSAELRNRAWSAMSATWSAVLSVTCAISLVSLLANMVTTAIPGVGAVLSFVVNVLVAIPTLGLVNGMLGYLRGKLLAFDCIQSMFPYWKQAIIFNLWTGLCLMGWMLAGVGVGVVLSLICTLLDASGELAVIGVAAGMIVMFALLIRAMLNYSVAQCIFVDDPNGGARNALRKSKEMMRGCRWHFVKMEFPVYLVMLVIGLITTLLSNVLPTMVVTLVSTVLSIAPNVMMRYFAPVLYEELRYIGR